MSKYEATFEATARVLIKFELSASNQQEGLVAAHDIIRTAQPSQAQILNVDLDNAVNVAFERIGDEAEVLPPSPLALSGRYLVKLFLDKDCQGQPRLESSEMPNFDSAKALAESVLKDRSPYGSASVTDEYGAVVLKVNAPRGGWEVEAFDDADQLVHRDTWHPSSAAAKAAAFLLLERAGVTKVQILDSTDRENVPVIWKVIR